MEKEIYLKLKKNLPHGAMNKIAKRHNVSRVTVMRVAKGLSKNTKIFKDLMDEAREYIELKTEFLSWDSK